MDRILGTIQVAPVATLIFVAILAASLAAFQNQSLMVRWMLRPYDMVRYRKWYMLISSGFIHANLQHLLLNGLTFYFIVFDLENLMVHTEQVNHNNSPDIIWVIVGHAKFFVIYMASLIVSDLTTVMKYKDDSGYASLGASGAISGMVMSFVIFEPNIMIWGIIPGWVFAVGYVAYSYFAARNSNDNIGHEAHLWGALAGLGFTAIMYPKTVWRFIEQIAAIF